MSDGLAPRFFSDCKPGIPYGEPTAAINHNCQTILHTRGQRGPTLPASILTLAQRERMTHEHAKDFRDLGRLRHGLRTHRVARRKHCAASS